MSSRENQSKPSRYAVGSSSHSRQSAEAEHVEFDNTLFIGPLQQAQFYSLVERQVISNEIRRIAISGHSHGNKASMTLGFPALITGLCRKVGVDIPNVSTKRISSIVNEDYVLCVLKLAGEAAPQPREHAPPTGTK
ncbi:hypothetical protein RYX36_019184 [Vicia faba]